MPDRARGIRAHFEPVLEKSARLDNTLHDYRNQLWARESRLSLRAMFLFAASLVLIIMASIGSSFGASAGISSLLCITGIFGILIGNVMLFWSMAVEQIANDLDDIADEMREN